MKYTIKKIKDYTFDSKGKLLYLPNDNYVPSYTDRFIAQELNKSFNSMEDLCHYFEDSAYEDLLFTTMVGKYLVLTFTGILDERRIYSNYYILKTNDENSVIPFTEEEKKYFG